MQAASSLLTPVLAMDVSTVLGFKIGALIFFLAFFTVVLWRVATRKEAFYDNDATIVLQEDNVTEPHQGVHHE
ncbi:MAG: hypothetical protein JKY61_01400 [Planctomycetes bacterium]|nr:hypothetical protein [Planctomycetota bacterium]